MDSIKSFKGYGKVNEAEDKAFQKKARKRLIIIISSCIILVIILIGAVIGVVVNKNSSNDTSSPPSTPTTSIKAICSVTQYPDSCFNSISSIKGANLTTDPQQIFKLSLQVASNALTKLSSLPDKFTIPTNDKRLAAALRDCKELFSDALDRLNDSVAELSQQPADDQKVLTKFKIQDLKSWLSAAIADQETCLDGFEGTTGHFRDKMKSAMVNSTEFTSNSLAIVAGVMAVIEQFDFQIHRKLLGSGEFPEWVSGEKRRIVLEANSGLLPNVTVAKDGSGQVLTIREAVELVPKKNLYPFVIYVKEGEYVENVVVDKSKWNVIVRGDGMYKSVVTGSLNFIDGTPTFSTATFVAVGKGFMAQDMGFKNTAGPQKHQAVALRVGSDRSVFHRCSFDAYQDTLYAHALRQFYRECDITGTVDFIFGDASVVLQKCNIRPRQPLPNQQNIITAQGRKDLNENTGIAIQACTIEASGSVTARTYLGRPWKPYSTTIIMQSEIGSVVDPSGWLPWVWGTDPPETIYYAEYQNTGPGSGLAARVKWVGYRPAVSAEEASKYTVNSFLDGSDWISQTGVLYESTL